MTHSHAVAITVVLLAAAVSLALSFLAARAWRASGSHKLGFVTAAFWTFFVKSVLTAYSLHTGLIGHEDLEVVNSVLDLTIVGLLIAPFLAPSSRQP